ncbi:cAMP-binding domain of CRP or a regulatory subunit of cAMP-dependent protein kinases [Reichenbachiella agariperforans]|uniref:cAMP-binding domain of CRP or a regulatory subunit of cAMP-dependent protein kinases n=1 Tax=Reichenbachiella agariperforans TaxID=156994 RepID=A0A1M6KWY3_REIAG|nr:Crp/Fnr family transcriptional regulator [Reichenbachiella agariperforans]SHJ63477.1 cAMP-binding domain of CRP or a regulatory subunit of cAMP-dependent protein kinases [Reichenbachiella agariperforans]
MNDLSRSDKEILFTFFNSACHLAKETFEEISIYFIKRSYKKGESILKIGEIETKANIVVKGVVHQYIFDEGESKTVNITPKGLGFNNLKSYIVGSPSIEVHEAITEVEIISIEKSDMEMLVQKNQEISYLMFKVYERILLDRENRMIVLQNRNPSKRFSLFYETVERANRILKDTQDKYIANYLNMTPQQYSKEKKFFFRENYRTKLS